ncbi:MAG: 50S ribosomal protein L4 [Parcubacteria group bacterium GW2011_GWB1_35_5]|uniref:Large ribosomal subunit protein uL4 n=1 Tax=Candidatus Zambryskibacteria bacterium RIFCSPLOWO2_01_FULL_35_19 TaxID=1802757 RepID=A0A1G2TYB1_9BACT|nr:MAG: 50S ribosomal protein L4 [Parcubacteria group bacterium GW2011_GWC1_34_10]KKP81363.1 MAG: 50S ribosomal protein L4 [Parcubacteria group bacterium GW2011_GWB1_35_5]OHA85858.1 MAG: 50S ribosomal protein L4 [Candidatus Zambryskibacteria bacterium RIFCSPHIGHO2_01_FULL_35_32]OHB02295.1 MAG: 50S ribosomal protein L4 [Candidatus Zambryskibacteria bacterium RIFCSPLOWO2_01_FULL_35_19]
MEAVIYNQTGKETGKIKLPETVFGLPWNEDLVHQVATSMMANKRTPIAHTKTRGEVSGTGKKPWRQKGTGRARHGSRRSPIWVGGGVTHGPRNDKDYSKKINKKMKAKALFTVLSRKFKDGEVFFLDNISLKEPKTKEAKNIIVSLSKIKEMNSINRRKNAVFIALQEKNTNTLKSFSNFGNLEVGDVKDLNVLDLLQYRYLIVTQPEESMKTFSVKLSSKVKIAPKTEKIKTEIKAKTKVKAKVKVK